MIEPITPLLDPITPLSLLPALLGLDVLGVLPLPLTRLFAPFEVERLGVWAERLLVLPDERLPPLPEEREGPLAPRDAVVPRRAAAALLGVPPPEPDSPVADLLLAVLAPLLALFPPRDADWLAMFPLALAPSWPLGGGLPSARPGNAPSEARDVG